MKDSDLLSRAARALREEYDGERAGSGYTRARIMRQLHQKRRRRLLAWVGFSPLFALVAGSAWAQGTDSWQRVWDGVNYGLSAFTLAVSGNNDIAERELDAPSARATAPAHDAASSTTSAAPSEIQPSEALLPVTDPLSADAGASKSLASNTGAAKQKRIRAKSLPNRDPELAEFRLAHDAHFRGGSHSAALAAYQSYLKRFPRGRFVPEARYNVGLLQLKLGDVEAAKSALLPFAQGAFGGYRQHQAVALLEALDNPAPLSSK